MIFLDLESDSRVDSFLDGSYGTRTDPINKCYQATLYLGYSVFGVINGGRCASSATAQEDYQKLGKEVTCNNKGTGIARIAQMYEINGKVSR